MQAHPLATRKMLKKTLVQACAFHSKLLKGWKSTTAIIFFSLFYFLTSHMLYVQFYLPSVLNLQQHLHVFSAQGLKFANNSCLRPLRSFCTMYVLKTAHGKGKNNDYQNNFCLNIDIIFFEVI